jgi:hypothetical protein
MPRELIQGIALLVLLLCLADWTLYDVPARDIAPDTEAGHILSVWPVVQGAYGRYALQL